ncbi:hypothetical protein MTO96_050025, partial [Rhipicephalus appendiculatus]
MALDAATNLQYHHLKQDGTTDDPMEHVQDDDDTVSRNATSHQSHDEEDASWQAVKSTKQRNHEALERRRSNAGPQDQFKTGTSTFKKLPKLPPLPKDDYKIVIRPNQGLPLRNILTPTLAQAIIEACKAAIKDDQFILRINPGSNIAILSTKYEEVADKARLIRTLVLNGRGSRRSCLRRKWKRHSERVIHGVPMNTWTETLMAHLRVRTHGVEIITARMIGTTKSAAITFFGPTLPRTVYYYGGELRCYPFRPTIQVCKGIQLANRDLSHRNLNSPQIQAGHSDRIHQENTNDPPRTKTLRWFSSKEKEDAYKSADDKQCSQSHAQSLGRKPCSPPKKSAPASPRENLHHSPPGSGAKSDDGDQGHTQQASSLP